MAGYVMLPEMKPSIRAKVRQIRFGAGDQVVQAKNLPAFGDEVITQMGSQEAGPTSNYGAQISSPLMVNCPLDDSPIIPESLDEDERNPRIYF